MTRRIDEVIAGLPKARRERVEAKAARLPRDMIEQADSPRQNRVTPFGDIVAVPARGTLMGNRGCLHDAQGRIRRPYRLTNWIYCLLEFRGRRRAVMSPGRYTELFFLDEATALAAGHRPCFECQRERYRAFMACWARGNPDRVAGETLRAPAVDAVLQGERFGADGGKPRWRADAGDLPAGAMLEADGKAWRVEEPGGTVRVRAWSAAGYGERRVLAAAARVAVLTPESVVNAIRQGFAPRPLPD